MFTSIIQPSYQGKSANEHIWTVEDPATSGTHIATLAATMLGNDIVRVRFIRGAQVEQTRYQVVDQQLGTLPYHSWIISQGDEQWTQRQEAIDNHTALEPYLQGFSCDETALRLTRSLGSQQRIYGLGERTGPMNKRGQAFPIWNVDPPMHHNTSTQTMYTSIPFYIGFSMNSGRTYGVLIDHTGLVNMDMGKTNEAEATITVEGDSLVVYFLDGPTSADIMRQYTALTGHMPLPARWTLGHHQCRWGYTSAQEVLDIATQFRERNHPCDAMWLDIDYMQGYRNFTWNKDTFPNPTAMTQQLHAQGFHLVTIIDPGTKIDEQYDVYQQIMQHEYYCRYENGEVFKGNVWPGTCVFPDFSQTATRTWWGNLYQRHLDQTVDGIWNDMDEPSLTNFLSEQENEEVLHGKTIDDAVLHSAGGNDPTGPDGPAIYHKFFHNAYGMEMARASYEGLLRLRPDSRPFVLTRSGTAGMQRYAALWTGDNTSEWEHIPLAITMCLNLGMSGVAFVGADIGGFWDHSNGELLVRFAQMGVFMPFCRNHSGLQTIQQEPWAFGEPYESAYRTAIETRYQLLPYLYTLFHEAASSGTPIMRPLYYHYPQDEQACETETAFLIGDFLLSAPILEPSATSREVYLPGGTWLDYWDGTEYPGNTISTIPAPLEHWPLLVRGNSILPSGPAMQYIGQLVTEPLTFTCYMTTDGLANYTLYEDDGDTQAYRNGAFATTAISCRVENDTITVRIDEQHQGYQPQREAYEVIVRVGNRVLKQRVKAGQGSVTVHF